MILFLVFLALFAPRLSSASVLNEVLLKDPSICYSLTETEFMGRSSLEMNAPKAKIEVPKAFFAMEDALGSAIVLMKKICTSQRQKLSRVRDTHREIEALTVEDSAGLRKVSTQLSESIDDYNLFLTYYQNLLEAMKAQIAKKFDSASQYAKNLPAEKMIPLEKEINVHQKQVLSLVENEFKKDIDATRFLMWSLDQRKKALVLLAEGKSSHDLIAQANIGKPLKKEVLQAEEAADETFRAPIVKSEPKWWDKIMLRAGAFLGVSSRGQKK